MAWDSLGRQLGSLQCSLQCTLQCSICVLLLLSSFCCSQTRVVGYSQLLLAIFSHHALRASQLPADGTDRLVELVQQEQDAAAARREEPALYGAKITGGGCGGELLLLAGRWLLLLSGA